MPLNKAIANNSHFQPTERKNQKMTNQNIGTIVQVIGAVLDIRFPTESLPNLLNAIEIDNNGQKLVVEVAQHIGDDIVRCIAMGSTDGLVRGMEAEDTEGNNYQFELPVDTYTEEGISLSFSYDTETEALNCT